MVSAEESSSPAPGDGKMRGPENEIEVSDQLRTKIREPRREFFIKYVENRGTTALLYPIRLYGLFLRTAKSEINEGVLSLTML